MEAKVGIKESMELLEGVKALGVHGKALLKDGKISVADLPLVMALVADAQKIVDAVQGVEGVLPEMKDIDEAEAKALVEKVFEVIAAIKAA